MLNESQASIQYELQTAVRLLAYWYDGVISLGELEDGLAGLSLETIELFPDKLAGSDKPSLKERVLDLKYRIEEPQNDLIGTKDYRPNYCFADNKHVGFPFTYTKGSDKK